MLQYDSVRTGSSVFRFVLGNELPTLPVKAATFVMASLRAEAAKHGDMVMLDAIDGPKIEAACSCGEKTVAWL